MHRSTLSRILGTFLTAAFFALVPACQLGSAQEKVKSGEAELRKAVADFYTLLKAKRVAQAEEFVTPETLERFKNMPNGEFLSARIQSIQFGQDNKSAIVNINLLVSAANVPVPFELPRKTEWRLESGQWRIIIPPPPEDGTTAMFSNTASKSGNLPKLDLVFPQPIVDLTPIKQGDRKIAKFEFSNSSNHPVTIENIEADCGCVVLKTELKTYKPGEVGILEFEFDSTKYAYEFGQTVAINTNPGGQRVNLLIKANVTPKQ